MIVYGDFASGPRLRADKGGPPTVAEDRAGRPAPARFLGVVSGYRGDFTNTFAVGGGPTARQRELFEACLGASGRRVPLKPGTPGREVDAAVRGHFASLGLDHAFTSPLGPRPGPRPSRAAVLRPREHRDDRRGDVVALEPGLYIEGEGGMRFERNYLITADGFETLSNHELRIEQ